MRRSVTLLPCQTRQELFRRTGQHILTVEDYIEFYNGQDDWNAAMKEGYYGA